MTELDVHKALISFGNLPLLIVLQELEDLDEYEKCAVIKNGIESYILRFPFLGAELKTKYTPQLQKEYYRVFKEICPNLVEENIYYYIKEVKLKLGL